MKFNFWFNLPNALINLAKDSITKEEIEFGGFLINSQEVKIS